MPQMGVLHLANSQTKENDHRLPHLRASLAGVPASVPDAAVCLERRPAWRPELLPHQRAPNAFLTRRNRARCASRPRSSLRRTIPKSRLKNYLSQPHKNQPMITETQLAVLGLLFAPVAALAIGLGSPSPAEETRAQERVQSDFAVWHDEWADTRETLGEN